MGAPQELAPQLDPPLHLDSRIQDLPLAQAAVDYAATGSEIFGLFKADASLPGVILIDRDQFRGMIPRQRFYEHITSFRYSIDVFWNRSIQILHPFFAHTLLMLSGATPIPTAAQRALQRPSHQIYEPIVVQQGEQYHLLDARVLLLAQAQIHQLTSQALQVTEARQKALLEVIPDLLLRIDHQDRVIDLRGDLRLVTQVLDPPLVGLDLRQTLPDPLASQLIQALHQALTHPGDHGFEIELTLLDQPHWVEVRMVVINEREILAIIRDVTERHQRENYRRTLERNQALELQMQEMQRLNRLKDDFLSTVSHELRTPMTSMKMAIERLKLAPDPDARDRYLHILSQECQREMALITDLLDLQQLEAGVRPRQLSPLPFNLWLRSLCDIFQIQAQERQQGFQLQIPDLETTPMVITTDKSVLQRVVTELLTNACKYTPPQGRIRVKAEQHPDGICLQITNTCEQPIPPEELPRLFEKFYRLPNGDPWRQGGTGLGLALIRQSIEWLGGQIRAYIQDQELTLQVELIDLPPDQAGADGLVSG